MIKTGKRIIKYLTITFIILSVLTIGSAVLFIHFYPEEKVLALIKENSSEFLNRKVDIASVDYSYKGIVLKNIKISENDTTSEDTENKTILKAEEAVIRFMPWALLRKEVKIWSVTVLNGTVNILFRKNSSNIKQLIDEIKSSGSDSKEKESSFRVTISKFVLKNLDMNISGLKGQFSSLNGKYLIDSKIVNNKFKSFKVADTTLTLPKKKGIIFPELMIDIQEELNITGSARIKSLNLDWVYLLRRSKSQLPFQWVNANLSNISANKEFISADIKATSTIRNFQRNVSAAGHCKVVITPKKIVTITNTKGKLGESPVYLNRLQIDADRGELSVIQASNSSVYVSDLRGLIRSIPSRLRGLLTGDFKYNGTINGDVKLSNIRYVTNNIEVFKIPAATLNIKNGEFKSKEIPVMLLDNNRATLSVASIDRNIKKIYAVINSGYLNLNKLSMLHSGKGGETLKNGKLDVPAYIFGKLYLKEVEYEKYHTSNARVDYSISGTSININNLRTSIFKGDVIGRGKISTGASKPLASANFRFNGIHINEIKFLDQKINNKFYGIASGRANLKFTIGDRITESTSGNVVLDISNGKIVNTGIQNGLILFLSDLKYKLKDLEFKKIYGNIDIRGNNYLAKSFIFNSEDVRLLIQGQLNRDLIAKNMDMRLEFNNHFIRDIPRPAVTLLRKYSNGKWYEIPFKLNGKITDSKNMKLK